MHVHTPITVRYGETDMMGVVYHANYLLYFEDARIDFLNALDFSYAERIEGAGYMSPIHDIEIHYKRPLRYGEAGFVRTSIAQNLPMRTVYRQQVYRAEDALPTPDAGSAATVGPTHTEGASTVAHGKLGVGASAMAHGKLGVGASAMAHGKLAVGADPSRTCAGAPDPGASLTRDAIVRTQGEPQLREGATPLVDALVTVCVVERETFKPVSLKRTFPDLYEKYAQMIEEK